VNRVPPSPLDPRDRSPDSSSGSRPPLPDEAIASALRPFGTSSLLPAAAYTDESVFAWETAHFFDGGWVCVGREEDLADRSSQRAVEVGSSSVLLSRARDGVVRAFANICRHRGHELLPCGAVATRGVIQCPYHAWSYELDGALRLAPHVGGTLDPIEFGLVPVPLASWGGWLFVNLDGRAAPFEHHVGELPSLLANWGCEELRVGVSHHYELAAGLHGRGPVARRAEGAAPHLFVQLGELAGDGDGPVRAEGVDEVSEGPGQRRFRSRKALFERSEHRRRLLIHFHSLDHPLHP